MDPLQKNKAITLSSALGVSERFAELLVCRGIEDVQTANRYLYPTVDQAEDPFLLSGMREATERIRAAIENEEKIVVYGDYDCDGICAVSILTDYLRSIGADVDYFIPNRFETGYGLSVESLEQIAETVFPDLIITVDCGISSVEEAEYLQEVLAIDLIVTDHHNLPDVLPGAIVVDPKLDLDTASRDLCGAGVAFKLVQALGGMDVAWKYVELAAVATIGDVVPLTGENRLITSLGLKKIHSREPINKGLRLLLESVNFPREELTAGNVAFHVVPRINALGRLGDCSEVVSLFTAEEYVVLQGLIEKMDRVNELRKSLVEETQKQAFDMMKDYDLSLHKVILLYDPNWNPGILGLVASRLKTVFSRPVILLSGEEQARGSARAPEGADMSAILKSAESVLVKFGGHKGAAGLTVERDKIIQARDLMDEFVQKTYPDDLLSRKKKYDLALSPEEVTLAFAEEVELLEPTGEGNRKPLFLFNSSDCPPVPFGNGENVKCRLNEEAEIIGFKLSHLSEGIAAGGKFDLLCELSKNVFKNRAKAQMRISAVFPKEFAPASDDAELFHRYLRSFFGKEEHCDVNAISIEEIKDVLYDDAFGTLFVAFSQNAAKTLASASIADKVRYVSYGVNEDAPWNSLLFAPKEDPIGYKRIVLLDTPLGKAYPSRLASKTAAEIYVVKENYPYASVFRSADLSSEAIAASYARIRRFVFSGGGALSPMDLMQRIENGDLGFLIRFYILFDNGSISVSKGFSLSLNDLRDPAESLLYRRLVALRKLL